MVFCVVLHIIEQTPLDSSTHDNFGFFIGDDNIDLLNEDNNIDAGLEELTQLNNQRNNDNNNENNNNNEEEKTDANNNDNTES